MPWPLVYETCLFVSKIHATGLQASACALASTVSLIESLSTLVLAALCAALSLAWREVAYARLVYAYKPVLTLTYVPR